MAIKKNNFMDEQRTTRFKILYTKYRVLFKSTRGGAFYKYFVNLSNNFYEMYEKFCLRLFLFHSFRLFSRSIIPSFM